MTDLAALQRAFAAYVTGRSDEVARLVADGPRADRATLLGVYRHAYGARLAEALRADFPALAAALGDEAFDAMARAYAEARPSRHPSIRWFGRHLADWLAGHPGWRAHGWAAALARWEWALGEAFDAPDAVPASFADALALPGAAWPGLRFRLLPSFRRVVLDWSVVPVRAAVDAGRPPPRPEPSAPPVAWAVWRPALTTEYRSLAPDEDAMLAALAAGGDFTALCEALLPWHAAGDAPPRAAGLVRAWLDQGMIAALVPP